MADSPDSPDSPPGSSQQQSTPPPTIQQYLMANKYDAIFLFIRLYIVLAVFMYIVPVFGMEYSLTCFKRVLLGSACISALRMHQRLPRITLSKEFIRVLVMEDSFHYLIYSLLFLASHPQTIALVPILVFAVLHSASYTQKLFNATHTNSSMANMVLQVTAKITERSMQTSILTFISSTEIMIFFVSIILLFAGRGSLLIPFFYYRFLQLRYMSTRNPYSRLVFGQFRMKIQELANNPSCPAMGKKALHFMISMASKLSPTTMTAPASS